MTIKRVLEAITKAMNGKGLIERIELFDQAAKELNGLGPVKTNMSRIINVLQQKVEHLYVLFFGIRVYCSKTKGGRGILPPHESTFLGSDTQRTRLYPYLTLTKFVQKRQQGLIWFCFVQANKFW